MGLRFSKWVLKWPTTPELAHLKTTLSDLLCLFLFPHNPGIRRMKMKWPQRWQSPCQPGPRMTNSVPFPTILEPGNPVQWARMPPPLSVLESSASVADLNTETSALKVGATVKNLKLLWHWQSLGGERWWNYWKPKRLRSMLWSGKNIL